MYVEQRREAIVRKANAQGSVSVTDLARAFQVTTETVRRDLDALADDGLLKRVHGGALAIAGTGEEPSVPQRAVLNVAAKAQIARASLELIPSGRPATVVLDGGTTTQMLCDLLGQRPGLTVYTNSLLLASTAAQFSGLTVMMAAGQVRGLTQAVVGAETVATFANLHPDIAFLGCNGMTPEQGFTTPDVTEAAVKQQIAASAAVSVVVADYSKFGVVRTHTFARPDDIDVLVTDNPQACAGLAKRVIGASPERET